MRASTAQKTSEIIKTLKQRDAEARRRKLKNKKHTKVRIVNYACFCVNYNFINVYKIVFPKLKLLQFTPVTTPSQAKSHTKYIETLGGASFVEMRIKQADLNTDKLFLDFDILKENIGIAARGLSRGEAACYRIKY